MRRALIPLLLVGGCTRRGAAPAPLPATLTFSSAPQQTIKGWGIYPCTIQNDRAHPELYTLWHRPNAARLIWRDLHPTFWRCEILPGSYSSRDDGSLDAPYLDASLGRQIRLARSLGQTRYILSIWSPPQGFKSPPTTRGVDAVTGRASSLRPEREADFCRFIARVLGHLQAEKLPLPFALSVQNEPNYAAPLWNGTAMTPAQWARLVPQMRRFLDQNGLQQVQLIGPEGGSYGVSVAFVGGPRATALRDLKLRRALAGFAFHGYTIDSKYPPQPQNLRSVATQMQAWDKDVWMSEWSLPGDRPDALDHALQTAQRLGRETAYIPCNYWTWWQGWYFRHPKGEVLLTGADDGHLHISKTYRVLQRLWQFAPAGSVVHRIRSSDPQLSGFDPLRVQCVGFEFRGRQTWLLTNPTRSARAVIVRGLKGRAATPYLTDSSRDMARQAPLSVVAGAARATLAARSITILATG